jgi:hypothetical protein
MRIRATGAPLYRLKVTLRGLRPPIWRRFVVPADIPLKRLHDALQAVMGWTNSHLHQFKAGGVIYGTSDPEFGVRRMSESRTALYQVLRQPKDRMMYEYDFGDGWEHDVVLEAVLLAEAGGVYPRVEAGKRACPPEDVGGVPGYLSFLEALRDPDHPERRELLDWIGGSFDPEEFTVRQANLDIHGGWTRVEKDI